MSSILELTVPNKCAILFQIQTIQCSIVEDANARIPTQQPVQISPALWDKRPNKVNPTTITNMVERLLCILEKGVYKWSYSRRSAQYNDHSKQHKYNNDRY